MMNFVAINRWLGHNAGSCQLDARQELLKFFNRQRPAEQIALHLVAVMTAQVVHLALGFDAVCTGHYARIRDGILHRAADPGKDQSYVLYMLGQEQLSRALFPLGAMTKAQTRAEAINARSEAKTPRKVEPKVIGGSTITQQLARNLFLNNSRTFDRKIREALLAMAIEQKFSKDQVLELYLNKVYFGGGAYGIDAASRKFFGHSATTLSLEEAAIIAGLVKAPSHYSPTADAKAAVDRAKVVVQTMQDAGAIRPAQAAAVDLKRVRLAAEQGQNSARYFTDWALPQLDLLLSNDSFEQIEVWTTLDTGMQSAAASAIPPAAALAAVLAAQLRLPLMACL